MRAPAAAPGATTRARRRSSCPQDATIGFDGKPLPDANVKLPERAEDAPPTARMFYVAYFKKDVLDTDKLAQEAGIEKQ